MGQDRKSSMLYDIIRFIWQADLPKEIGTFLHNKETEKYRRNTKNRGLNTKVEYLRNNLGKKSHCC